MNIAPDIGEVLRRKDLSHVAVRTYLGVRVCYQGQGCWQSKETIGVTCGLSVDGVSRGLRELVKRGVLERTRRGGGLPSVYRSKLMGR